MRYVKDGPYQHPICDFCDTDATANHIKWVRSIGEKGICNCCAKLLGEAIAKAERNNMATKKEEMFKYLDKLRESGVTNMYGAGTYLVRGFGFSRDESHEILGEWMKSSSERPAKADGR